MAFEQSMKCDWCRTWFERSRAGQIGYCSGRCRTAAHRARRKTSTAGLAAMLVAEAERVEVLAGQARNTGTNDALFVAQMLGRMATKLRGTAGMMNPDQLEL